MPFIEVQGKIICFSGPVNCSNVILGIHFFLLVEKHKYRIIREIVSLICSHIGVRRCKHLFLKFCLIRIFECKTFQMNKDIASLLLAAGEPDSKSMIQTIKTLFPFSCSFPQYLLQQICVVSVCRRRMAFGCVNHLSSQRLRKFEVKLASSTPKIERSILND